MAIIYGDNVPRIDQLKPGDVIQFGERVTFQNPTIQDLAKQNVISGWQDPKNPTGGDAGVLIIKQPLLPTTTTPSMASLPPQSALLDNLKSNLLSTQNQALGVQTPQTPLSFVNVPGGVQNNLTGKFYSKIPVSQSFPTGGWMDEGGKFYSSLPSDASTTSTPLANNANLPSASDYNNYFLQQQRALEEAGKVAEAGIHSQYGPAIQNTSDMAGRATGALNRILGRAGGFTTTAGGQAAASMDATTQSEINRLKIAEQNAINSVRSAVMTKNADLIGQNYDKLYQIQKDLQNQQQQRFQNLLSLYNAVGQQQNDYYNIAKNIPEGKTVTINGTDYIGVAKADPFYKSSDLISLMDKVPMGQSFEVSDPNTGQVWSLQGTGENNNVKQFTATSNDGTYRIISYDTSTGKITGIADAGKIGKSGTGGVTVNMGGGLTMKDFIKQGFKRIPKPDGGFDFQDQNGNPLTVNQAATQSGVPVVELLQGSTRPEDVKMIESSMPSSITGSSNIIGGTSYENL